MHDRSKRLGAHMSNLYGALIDRSKLSWFSLTQEISQEYAWYSVRVSTFNTLRARWGVGLWGTVAILLAFSLAGITVVRLRQPVLALLLPSDAPTWLSWVVYLVILFPMYQTLLLGYGALLGQFNFFWGRLKAVGHFLTNRKAKSPS